MKLVDFFKEINKTNKFLTKLSKRKTKKLQMKKTDIIL